MDIGQHSPGGIYSPGYTAPELENGENACQKWDLFALGRTFVYLLTGNHPAELEGPTTGAVIWRDKANVSQELKDFIDMLMAPPNDSISAAWYVKEWEKRFGSQRNLPRKWLVPVIALMGIAAIFIIYRQQPEMVKYTSLVYPSQPSLSPVDSENQYKRELV